MVFGRFFKLNKSVEKSRESVFSKIGGLFRAKRPIDEDLWEELETLLIQGDVGVPTTERVLAQMRADVRDGIIKDSEQLEASLQDALMAILDETEQIEGPLIRPDTLNVVLVVGVNGVGKTTTIAKLARFWTGEGHRVVLAAGDTFRAAAIDQLKIWGERANVPVVAHQPGADPGSVVFDAIAAARGRNANVVIVDTAGRLHTKYNLMEELRKIRRVVDKQNVEAVRTLLVLDATTGQNAILQARAFREAAGLDGIIVAKLDGTARAGVVFAIAEELKRPILFAGTGEKLDDLSEFDAEEFVKALFALC